MDVGPGVDRAERLVLGGDIGGTTTRILLADYLGRPRRRAIAAGANPVSHPGTAASAFESALRAALSGVDPGHVGAAVIGMAGGSALDQPETAAAFARVWAAVGLRSSPVYVPDLLVAFVSATVEPAGTVLVAGSGTSAAAIADRQVSRTAGGHGWLLGDEGSGFWLGREAARAALRSLDSADPPGMLATSVLRELEALEAASSGVSRPEVQRRTVINTLNNRPPARLGELAPLVSAAHRDGDPAAQAIVEEAAQLLAQLVGDVRHTEESTPIVLAGSVAAADSPVGTRLRRLVAERFAGRVRSAADGVGGAAWLALAGSDRHAATEEARARLTAP